MKSPFPGMDPYIESQGLWGDFRNHLLFGIHEAFADILPERYFGRVAERTYLSLADSEAKIIFPTPPHVAQITASRYVVTEDGSRHMRAFVEEEHREPFLTIYCEDNPEPRVVTRIEILSPSNKRFGTLGWKLYQKQRRRVLRSNVHLVEIDLLRAGQRPPMLDPWPESPYTLLIARAKNYKFCRVWPAYFQRALPVIPVPVLKPDADLSLDLQPLIDRVYELSRYGRAINYSKPLNPPLATEEQTWVEDRIRQWQKSK